MSVEVEGTAKLPYYSVAVGKRPWRIKSNEMFEFKVDFPEPVVFGQTPGSEFVHIVYRIYLLGFWLKAASGAALAAEKTSLYDTLRVPAWEACESFRMFTRPVGQSDEWDRHKTELDTNMMLSAQLRIPEEFDLWGFRSEMNSALPQRVRDSFRESAVWSFVHGDRRRWGGPLTLIPCGMDPISNEEVKTGLKAAKLAGPPRERKRRFNL